MKVEKKAVRSGILKLEKNVQITLDEDMNVPDTRPDVEKIIESRGEVHIDEIEVLTDRMRLRGNFLVQILYLSTDKEQQISCMEHEFSIEEFMNVESALPFWISGEIPSLIDALFETVSGFTTTGSSILADVEALSHCALFWRSFTHWIGGMGVLVFLLAVIPLSGGSHINLMRAESPGPSVGKLVPKIKYTAQILYCLLYTSPSPRDA